jgi:hypothetical protein
LGFRQYAPGRDNIITVTGGGTILGFRIYQKERTLLTLAFVFVAIAACNSLLIASDSTAPKSAAEQSSRVVLTSEVKWTYLNPARGDKAPMAGTLWGTPQDGQLNGTLVKLPAGFTGKIHSHASTFRAVVIQGQPLYQMPGETDVKALVPDSYFSSKGERVHQISSKVGADNIIYVRTDGKFNVISAQPKK